MGGHERLGGGGLRWPRAAHPRLDGGDAGFAAGVALRSDARVGPGKGVRPHVGLSEEITAAGLDPYTDRLRVGKSRRRAPSHRLHLVIGSASTASTASTGAIGAVAGIRSTNGCAGSAPRTRLECRAPSSRSAVLKLIINRKAERLHVDDVSTGEGRRGIGFVDNSAHVDVVAVIWTWSL